MSLGATLVRLLRLSPALSSSMTLMFALDEHLIFGTWVCDPIRPLANSTLPAWWTRGGLRWRWVLILFYPATYLLALLNLLVSGGQPGSAKWYLCGLFFSIAHMFFVRMALRRIAAIEKGIPKGNVVRSMEAWLKMNWVRALITDLPAWLCFIAAAVKGM
ncbi:87f177c6-26d8-4f13-b6d9-7585c337b54a [Thermothielavioides terrestris]|uniref:87f177c6-26d8-4f13-b6d9-7585c337b54a n=2 Tax=Thermothielavioides terrestris TaxID=2587410 RepID=A0A3S4BLK0_9PEZI|nr:87f177c6-26d8-4f13-b6d9-7585c337b54a [Thermothielavioides terrestris]